MTSFDRKSILFFTPFGHWMLHNQVDTTVAAALRHRGHHVRYLTCDSLYHPCSMTREKQDCTQCQNDMDKGLSTYSLDSSPLGKWMHASDLAEAEEWLREISDDDLVDARFEDLPIGEWALSTVFTHFRVSQISQLRQPRITPVHRRFLRDTLCTFRAVNRVLEEESFDAILLFNGRFYPYRAALEAARRHGLRILLHERGRIGGSFIFYENESIFSSQTVDRLAADWSALPLNEAEMRRLQDRFSKMLVGQSSYWPAFYREVRQLNPYQVLDIPQSACLLGFFPSSSDEIASQPGYGDANRQYKLIDDVAEAIEGTDIYLIVRHHPHIAGDASAPMESDDFNKAYRQSLTRRRNVRVVMPRDDLTSYALFPYLTAAIAPTSTIAGELTAFGIPSLVSDVSEAKFDERFILRDWSPRAVHAAVQFITSPSAVLKEEDLRCFYRRYYAVIFRFSVEFRLIGFENYFQPFHRYQGPDDLLPGGDSAVDSVCDHLIAGPPVHPRPSADEASRTDEVETLFLRDQIEAIGQRERAIKASRAQPAASPPIARLASFAVLIDDLVDGPMVSEMWKKLPYAGIVKFYSLPDYKVDKRLISSLLRKLRINLHSDFSIWRSRMLNALADIPEDYVLLTTPRFQYHDTSIAVIAEAIQVARATHRPIVALPGWVPSSDGFEISALRPQRNSFKEWCDRYSKQEPSLRPRDLLAIMAVRRDCLLEVLGSRWRHAMSELHFARAIFRREQSLSETALVRQPVFLLQRQAVV